LADTISNIKPNVAGNVISEICGLAEKHGIEQVILFGSRARGDNLRTSDIDLATVGGDHNRFALDVDEETSTLLRFDVVDLDGPVQAELRESIRKEGVTLYEKNR
jgi:predicted nucleotidyltransferase